MTVTVRMTHKGFFFVCPVYVGNLEGAAPFIHARHALFDPLFTLSEWVLGVWFAARSFFQPTYEPVWPLVLTAELNPPLTIYDAEDTPRRMQ